MSSSPKSTSVSSTASTLVTLNHLKNENLVIATHKCNGAPADYILQVAEDTFNYLTYQYPQKKNPRLLLLALSDNPLDTITNHFFLVEAPSSSTLSVEELRNIDIELGAIWDIFQVEHQDWEITNYHPYPDVQLFTDPAMTKDIFHQVFLNYLQDLTDDHITFYQINSAFPSDPPISYIIGDIGHINDLLEGHTRGDCVAVVNAANAQLATGGGVTGALVRGVGGSSNWNQLMQKAQYQNGSAPNLKKGLKTGEAVWTPTAGLLQKDDVKAIIHTLGPVAGCEPIELITDSISNVLELANHLQIDTLILPAISGGIFASGHPTWPTEIRQLILTSVKAYMKNVPSTSIRNIYLISYDQNDQNLWPVNIE